MTIVITQNVLYCSSISAIKPSEFEIILTFKVVDLQVFFNLQLNQLNRISDEKIMAKIQNLRKIEI